jgi:hypothetical protein
MPHLKGETVSETRAMDYAKSGNPRGGKDARRHKDVGHELAKPKGSTKKPNLRPTKEELLARLKADAEAKKG